MRRYVAGDCWDDQWWIARGAPQFSLFLDNTSMGDEGVERLYNPWAFVHRNDYEWSTVADAGSRKNYLGADRFRGSRQLEWLPKSLMQELVDIVSPQVKSWEDLDTALDITNRAKHQVPAF